MLCKFCQENVRGTPCQSAAQAAKCINNRDDDWPDDNINSQKECQNQCEVDKESDNKE